MNLHLSVPLSSLVSQKYVAAKEAGDLLFSPTTLSVIYAVGIPFQLRYCPALSQKPAPHHHSPQTKKPKPNPFADPSPSLLIIPLPANSSSPSHNLVLNKYPVIPSHSILATKEFKRQTDLLEREDLGVAYACLRAWEDEDGGNEEMQRRGTKEARMRRLFAFFNSGPHSGASQPHRHIQFLPIEEMSGQDQPSKSSTSSYGTENEWSLLADSITSQRVQEEDEARALPFTIFTAPLPPEQSISADRLHDIYLDLYAQAVTACEAYTSAHPSERDVVFHSQYSSDPSREHQEADGGAGTPAEISYNLSLTTNSMALSPRRSEGAGLFPAFSSDVVGEGEIALNGTILAGTLMVKAETEWDELRERPEKLEGVLEAVGIPSTTNNSRGGSGKL